MNLSRIRLEMLTWSAPAPKYKIGVGHYTLDKSKRVRKTKNSYSCWLKRSTKQEYWLHVFIKKREKDFELKVMDSKKKLMLWAGFLSLYEAHPNINKIRRNKDQYLLFLRSNSAVIHIHMYETKKK